MNSVLVTLVTVGLPMLLGVLALALLPFLLIGLGGWIFYSVRKRLEPEQKLREAERSMTETQSPEEQESEEPEEDHRIAS